MWFTSEMRLRMAIVLFVAVLGLSARAVSPQKAAQADELFGTPHVLHIRIEVAPAAIRSLRRDPASRRRVSGSRPDGAAGARARTRHLRAAGRRAGMRRRLTSVRGAALDSAVPDMGTFRITVEVENPLRPFVSPAAEFQFEPALVRRVPRQHVGGRRPPLVVQTHHFALRQRGSRCI